MSVIMGENILHIYRARIPCILAAFREWGAAATDQKKLISSRVPPGRGSGASWDVAGNVNLVMYRSFASFQEEHHSFT